MATGIPINIRKGLAFKMILYIFVSIMVIFIAIFHYTLRFTREIVVDNLQTNAEYLTKSTVARIEQVLGAIQRVPDNFIDLFEQGEPDEQRVKAYLKMIVENNKDIVGACLAYEPFQMPAHGEYYAPYYFRKADSIRFTNLGNPDYHYFLMDWYQLPKEIGKATWSEPYFDSGGADMVLSTYSVPVYQNKNGQRKLVGVLTVDISLDWLDEIMGKIEVAETGYGFIISRTGSIVTHPRRDFIMNESIFSLADEQNSPDLRRIGKYMIVGDTSFAQIEYTNSINGKRSWIAYAPVMLNGWSVGIVFPVDEFMAEANRLRLMVIGLGMGGGVLLILVIILISGSITRPLRRLTNATEAFANGDFMVELPQVAGDDEISRLNASFHAMQDTLAETIRDLQETSNNLVISHEKLEEYNRTLEEKVEERTATLKAAQSQLIQSEKMASLGQLTAGIAHEIKNPLNFVNNFSELSVELTTELLVEVEKLSGKLDTADVDYLKGIISDIDGNVRKINTHGKRADSIIRGMLLHSRGKSSERQLTDINNLLSEYVNLGYHGLRATDNTFNIKIETDYDPEIGKINVVPQDLSRVFLNIVNNACYATIQKKKEQKDAYFPLLKVSTKKEEQKVIIKIRDNGKGIPPHVIEKIFNPFFTTKPAGSGTGLGLSISYDIVVQEHKGDLRVESVEGEFTEFTLIIPVG
jgi:signal transduction histidine kinase